jgi:hypothetical protein
MTTKIKTKADEGAVKIVPKFGLARHRQVLKAAWAAERHAPESGMARMKVSGGQYRAKRGR